MHAPSAWLILAYVTVYTRNKDAQSALYAPAFDYGVQSVINRSHMYNRDPSEC